MINLSKDRMEGRAKCVDNFRGCYWSHVVGPLHQLDDPCLMAKKSAILSNQVSATKRSLMLNYRVSRNVCYENE